LPIFDPNLMQSHPTVPAGFLPLAPSSSSEQCEVQDSFD
jgi:hypothetical protein